MATETRLNPLPWKVERVDYPEGQDANFEIQDADGKVVAQTFMREIAAEPEYFAADEANCRAICKAINDKNCPKHGYVARFHAGSAETGGEKA